MNEIEYKQYLKEFKAWGKELTSSKKKSREFFISLGVAYSNW